MKRVEATPTPAVLIWAREKAGMSIELASERAGVQNEQLRDWEAGTARPTIPQLRKLATLYRRPLAVFYLSQAPTRFEVMHDFRKLSATEVSVQNSPKLAYEIRRAFDRREWALELMESLGEPPIAFAPAANLGEPVEKVATRFREALGVTTAKQSQWRLQYEAFRNWRILLENAGILTLQATGIELREARGFSVASRSIPVASWTRGFDTTHRMSSQRSGRGWTRHQERAEFSRLTRL